MQYVMLTNNPLVRDFYTGQMEVDFVDSYGYFDVLDRIRKLVHKGWIIETHPLSGSVKPNETPYKSVILQKTEDGAPLDFQSLQIVEKSIETYVKFAGTSALPMWSEKTLGDLNGELSGMEYKTYKLL